MKGLDASPGRRPVLVAPYGPQGASTRVRGLEWFRHLGVTPELSCYLGSADTTPRTLAKQPLAVARAERRLRSGQTVSAETVLLLRNASPLSNGRVEARILRSARHGVYDFDDALMLQQPGAAAAAFSRARAWRRAVGAANVVIAGNDYLADAASAHSAHVVMIPTCVEPGDYQLKSQYDLSDQPQAVWLGSPSTEKYLAAIAPALLAEHRRSGLRVTVISAGNGPLDGLEPIADRVAWRPDLAESTLSDADFGLMPLADGPWERGKCAYKLLQYAAAGLPTIGSPVGVNLQVLDLLGGLAPASTDDWVDALAVMVSESSEARRARGRRAAQGVTAHFGYERWAATWRGAVLDA